MPHKFLFLQQHGVSKQQVKDLLRQGHVPPQCDQDQHPAGIFEGKFLIEVTRVARLTLWYWYHLKLQKFGNFWKWFISEVCFVWDRHIYQTKKHADVIVPRGGENTVAIDFISQHMQVRKVDYGFIEAENYPGHYMKKQWIPEGVPAWVLREPLQRSLIIQAVVQVWVDLEHQLDFQRLCQFKPGL